MGEGTGIWKGSVGVVIRDPGEYHFWVQAEGDWQIDLQWPTPETSPVSETPFTASGTGDQAVYFVLVQTGHHTISMTHDGAGPFSVASLTSEGRNYIDRFSGSGPSSASLEFTITGKAFEFLLLNVRADGNWTIELN